ncbi:hypothetical protein L2E82_29862 [Cichorium intybus]|uniref:Uncharacterized protein n=1 Tax=Cichorium intybus TaxID=13427 RepID=A0ACB9CYT3_CICIN|nr:hypothetical protein L2E82_29862 [Cichorium intybus]
MTNFLNFSSSDSHSFPLSSVSLCSPIVVIDTMSLSILSRHLYIILNFQLLSATLSSSFISSCAQILLTRIIDDGG